MPARNRQGRNEPTQRQLRVGEEVRHTLSAVFNRNDIHDPVLDGVSITVSEVRMGPNLRSALVLIMPLAGENRDPVLTALKRATPYLRSQIGKSVHLKFTPTLRFEIDTRFDDADRMDKLLRTLIPNETGRLSDTGFGQDDDTDDIPATDPDTDAGADDDSATAHDSHSQRDANRNE